MRHEGVLPESVAGAIAHLRSASEVIRSAAEPQDALAAAACELAEASSFVAEAAMRRVSASREAQRQLLSEALSCTRAAGIVMRFALVQADDQVRSGAARSACGAKSQEMADVSGSEEV
ncbi:hypothetical protein GCM10010372_76280 [Streptomyces tauricus]|nr:hypothetical protein GCM10010372_76280 [Streptomyces tauricus]